jgi:hypothetical protein
MHRHLRSPALLKSGTHSIAGKWRPDPATTFFERKAKWLRPSPARARPVSLQGRALDHRQSLTCAPRSLFARRAGSTSLFPQVTSADLTKELSRLTARLCTEAFGSKRAQYMEHGTKLEA